MFGPWNFGSSGHQPVLSRSCEYLRSLPKEVRAAIGGRLRDANGLGGAQIVMRQVDGRLWELKFPVDRIFYVAISGPAFVLLHACRKQGQEAPAREIRTARDRMKEVLAKEE